MQIGIDVGATKIESVILNNNGEESHRSRTDCPKDYLKTVNTIRDIVINLEKEFNQAQDMPTHISRSLIYLFV